MKKKEKDVEKEIGLEDLAIMVTKGFDDMEKRIGERFDRLEKGQAALEKGQEEIKMDLGRQVSIFDHKELEFRVERLEEKVCISHRKHRIA